MQRDPETNIQARAGQPAQTLADGAEEAQRIVAAAQQQGLTLRLLGGLAVYLRCPSARHRALNRAYADLDFIAPKKQARALRSVLEEQGYTADRRFNALHGERRLLFYDEANQRQVDIFLGVFEMCHKLVVEPRLNLHSLTLDPADLLLTKLQIVQVNEKDIRDMLALLLDFEPRATTQQPGEELDMRVITQLCGQDWGWYTTVSDNLERLAREAPNYLEPTEAELVAQRTETIRKQIADAPKSAGWKMRAVVGRRMQWYELPEEVRR